MRHVWGVEKYTLGFDCEN